MPQDKRNVYDFDVRIHLVARGPGIKPGTVWKGTVHKQTALVHLASRTNSLCLFDWVIVAPATNVDIAPSLLTLAGVEIPSDTIDGHSFVSFLFTNVDEPEIPEFLSSCWNFRNSRKIPKILKFLIAPRRFQEF